MKKYTLISLCLMLFLPLFIYAVDGYYINSGETKSIQAHDYNIDIANNSSQSIFVPALYNYELESFVNYTPNNAVVTNSCDCTTNSDCGGSSISANYSWDWDGGNYCKNGDVYRDWIGYYCQNCSCYSNNLDSLVEDCLAEGDWYWVGGNYCKNGDVYRDWFGFGGCSGGDCEESLHTDWVEDSCASCETCSSGSCVIADTTSYKSCYGGDVYWYDSCGNRGSKVEDCTGGETCVNGVCECDCTTNSDCGGSSISANYSWDWDGGNYCKNGDVYRDWIGYYCQNCSCYSNNLDSLVEDCASCETCSSGSCVIADTTSYKSCYGGDVYWYDSCGNRGSKVEDCSYGCNSSTNTCISCRWVYINYWSGCYHDTSYFYSTREECRPAIVDYWAYGGANTCDTSWFRCQCN